MSRHGRRGGFGRIKKSAAQLGPAIGVGTLIGAAQGILNTFFPKLGAIIADDFGKVGVAIVGSVFGLDRGPFAGPLVAGLATAGGIGIGEGIGARIVPAFQGITGGLFTGGTANGTAPAAGTMQGI